MLSPSFPIPSTQHFHACTLGRTLPFTEDITSLSFFGVLFVFLVFFEFLGFFLPNTLKHDILKASKDSKGFHTAPPDHIPSSIRKER